MKNSPIERVIERVGDLPAMPTIVHEALRLTDDPNAGMHDIDLVLQRDPALAARLLRVSNSPYYGMRQYVGTLKLALVVLGIREIRNIILGVTVFDALRDDKTEQLFLRDFWPHSLMTGGVAARLAERFPLGLKSEAFLAGLLHDIGKLLLARCLPQQYLPMYEQAATGSEPIQAIERDTFGFTHADAAAALARHWSFPAALSDAISLHHARATRPLSTAADPPLAAITRLANCIVNHDFAVGKDSDLLRTDQSEEAWSLLQANQRQLSREERNALFADLKITVMELPKLAF